VTLLLAVGSVLGVVWGPAGIVVLPLVAGVTLDPKVAEEVVLV
jgi:hypothetical protein